MKKFGLLLVMLLAFLAMPLSALAEEDGNESGENSEEVTEESNEVKLYFFRGEGCPHCADAEEWFETIDGYGTKFKVVDYEVRNSADNSELMERVAEARGEDADGVPYIIVGNHSWIGFADEYKEEILSAIDSEYEKDVKSRYDIMNLLPELEKKQEEKSKSTDVVATIIIILVICGATFGIIKARKTTF